jgi:hypothetical protein
MTVLSMTQMETASVSSAISPLHTGLSHLRAHCMRQTHAAFPLIRWQQPSNQVAPPISGAESDQVETGSAQRSSGAVAIDASSNPRKDLGALVVIFFLRDDFLLEELFDPCQSIFNCEPSGG